MKDVNILLLLGWVVLGTTLSTLLHIPAYAAKTTEVVKVETDKDHRCMRILVCEKETKGRNKKLDGQRVKCYDNWICAGNR